MSSTASSVAGDGAARTVTAEVSVTVPSGASGSKEKHKLPQKRVDDFWKKFTTKAPGKVTTILPKNELAERLAKRKSAKQAGSGITAQASYEEAAALCRAKVEKIVQECRRVNQKYRDPHFDLELDLKTGRRDCLESLSNLKDDSSDSDSDSSAPSLRPPRLRKTRRHSPRAADRKKQSSPVAGGGKTIGGLLDELDNSPQGRTPGSKFRPRSVKRVGEIFDDPKFYIDGPTANDVRQGRDGDCWLMAALCTMSNKPGLIERVCVAHNQDVGVYGFVFHRDGEWISEIIDDKLYLTKPDFDEAISGGINMERLLWDDRERPDSEETYRKTYQSNSGALYFAQCENPNETWLPLLEKALAKATGDYAAIESGFTGEGIENLTGGVSSALFTSDILDKEYFWKEELMKVNQQFLFGCSTGFWGRGWGSRKGIIEGHAYSVMKAVEIDGERLVLLKNPWGKGEWTGPWSDGSKEWTPEWLQKLGHRFGDDGAFWISYRDLLRKYQAFDRTRLFGPDWKITSIWTTLSVPWTLEYHDTKFHFTLSRAGPVVLVLSQLDDRYFRGLEGQYKFGLGIRVHKAGEDDYLVRTQSAYRMTRSINVELDLDAGEYTVCVKLDAKRHEWLKPVEDVVRDNTKNRREKLIRIGLSYDLAHSKAKIIETEEEKGAREAYEKRKEAKQRERLRKLIVEEKERRHYQNVKVLNKQRKRMERRKEKRKKKQAEKEKRIAELIGLEKREIEKREAERRERRRKEAEEREKRAKEAEQRDAEKREAERKEREAKEKDEKEKQTQEAEALKIAKQEAGKSADSTTSSQASQKEAENNTQDKSEATKAQGPLSPGWSVGEDTPTTSASVEIPENQSAMPRCNGPVGQQQSPVGTDNTGKGCKTKTGPLSEMDEKLRRAIGIFASLKEELEAMLGGSEPADNQPPAHGHPANDSPHDMADMDPSSPGLPPHLPPPPPPLAPLPHEFPAGGTRTPPGREVGFHPGRVHHLPIPGPPPPPPPPPPPRSVVYPEDRDELSSVTTLSELSERELDYHFKDSKRQARLTRSQPHGPAQSTPQTRAPVQSEDEFEKDPWNAVAVVGLRVYYKLLEGDKSDDEIVRLRVVRPNPYYESSEDEEEEDEEDDGESGEEDSDGDNGKDGEGGEEQTDNAQDQAEELDESKVLDVDDSAKDATSQVVA